MIIESSVKLKHYITLQNHLNILSRFLIFLWEWKIEICAGVFIRNVILGVLNKRECSLIITVFKITDAL